MGIFDCDNSYIIENKQYKCEITVVLKAIKIQLSEKWGKNGTFR